jgi:hypothetical protein
VMSENIMDYPGGQHFFRNSEFALLLAELSFYSNLMAHFLCECYLGYHGSFGYPNIPSRKVQSY